VTAPPGNSDRAMLLAMARTQHLPLSGPQTWALYGDCTVDDLHQMVTIRQRALGAAHPSIATLFDALGDREDANGNLSIARGHYEAALKIVAPTDPNRIIIMSKLAALALRTGDPRGASELFTRCARFADSGLDDERPLDEAQAVAVPAVLASQSRADHLHELLRSDADSQVARRHVAEFLLRIDKPSTTEGDQRAAPAPVDESQQTEDVTTAADLPERRHLPADHLQRVRAPTTRGVDDLKSLIGYVAESRRVNDVANSTAATIDSIRKRMAWHSAVQPKPTTPTRQAPFTSSIQRLSETVERLKHYQHTTDHDYQAATPEQLTQREVARILLETSTA
jgi:hypothetical protein